MANQVNSSSIIHSVANTIKSCWKSNGKIKFMFVALGIFLSFIYVGIFQETIMRGCYGGEGKQCTGGEKFTFATSLVFVKSFCGLIFIKVLDFISPEKKKNTTHFLYYATSAAANSLSMVSANMALRWVSYPAQVIMKSAKPLSVMILGLMFCKKYTIQRYFFVFVIVSGVIVFKLYEPKLPKVEKTEKTTNQTEISSMYQMLGTGLLIFSLTMDGVLGAIQDRMRALHAPTFRQLMFNTYLWGCLYLIIAILVTREFLEVIPFIGRHPNVIWHLTTFGFADAVGNMFIFTMISCFGALACSVTGTVRKFFSVVFSIIFFGNPSTLLQWMGAFLVFSGLLADAAFGKKKHKAVEEPQKDDLEKGNDNNNDDANTSYSQTKEKAECSNEQTTTDTTSKNEQTHEIHRF